MSGPLPDRDNDGADVSSEALARLSMAFRPSLVRYFQRRVKTSSEVDDLVQEVFLRLLVRGGVEEMEHVEGYVFQTASSVLKDWLRRRAVRHADSHVAADPDEDERASISAERTFLGQEALRLAVMALLELPERTRTVFILRVLEGMQYQAVAQRLGISVSAVEKHMVRALRHVMDKSGDDPCR